MCVCVDEHMSKCQEGQEDSSELPDVGAGT